MVWFESGLNRLKTHYILASNQVVGRSNRSGRANNNKGLAIIRLKSFFVYIGIELVEVLNDRLESPLFGGLF